MMMTLKLESFEMWKYTRMGKDQLDICICNEGDKRTIIETTNKVKEPGQDILYPEIIY